MKQKLIQITRAIFSRGMAVLMVITLLVALCYLAAFVVGLPLSETICGFLDIHILPCVYIAGIAFCVSGVFNMYLCKTHVFLLDISKKKESD